MLPELQEVARRLAEAQHLARDLRVRRDFLILAAARRGATLRAIGAACDLHWTRVKQIVATADDVQIAADLTKSHRVKAPMTKAVRAELTHLLALEAERKAELEAGAPAAVRMLHDQTAAVFERVARGQASRAEVERLMAGAADMAQLRAYAKANPDLHRRALAFIEGLGRLAVLVGQAKPRKGKRRK